MRIIIYGATGNVGRLCVDKALNAGHEVTAFARYPGKIDSKDRLEKVRGDVLDRDEVFTSMSGHNAVLTVFGAPLNWSTITSVPDLSTQGTLNIVNAMKKHQVKRLICMTGIGAGDSKGHGRFVFDNLILPILLGRIYADKNLQEKLVMESGLDWTIVRPAELTNEPESNNYRVLVDLKGKKASTIARGDVADFLVGQLKSDRYTHQTPLITN